MSTSCVYPRSVEAAFSTASRLGYDGVELVVTKRSATYNADDLLRLSLAKKVPIVAVHAPCLLISYLDVRSDPWGELLSCGRLARHVGADVVVVHPPFLWQRRYAAEFVSGI